MSAAKFQHVRNMALMHLSSSNKAYLHKKSQQKIANTSFYFESKNGRYKDFTDTFMVHKSIEANKVEKAKKLDAIDTIFERRAS